MMATGYTHPVIEGKITEFKDFAMQCARAMGACITMRDEPWDAPIPEEFKPSDYYEKELVKARAKLAELEAMTAEQAEEAAELDNSTECARRAKYRLEELQANRRVREMLDKVTAWCPPTAEHVGLKEFMVDQLRQSIQRPLYPMADDPKPQPWRDWLDEQIKQARDHVGYYAAEYEKELSRARSRTAWIKTLRKSLNGGSQE